MDGSGRGLFEENILALICRNYNKAVRLTTLALYYLYTKSLEENEHKRH
jgi:hypothetical protein